MFKVWFKQIFLCISNISLAYQLPVEVADSQVFGSVVFGSVNCSVSEGFSILICCSVGLWT